MKNCLIIAGISSITLFCFLGCFSQSKNEKEFCNRRCISKSIAKKLPKSICIPDSFMIWDINNTQDFNFNKKKDLILSYYKLPQNKIDTTYYSLYLQIDDTTYEHIAAFSYMDVPYIGGGELYDFLLKKYGILKVDFNLDSILLTITIAEAYHKTLNFVFDPNKRDWFLESIEYWIGGVDSRLLERFEFDSILLGKVFLESKIPRDKISIAHFDLAKYKKEAVDIEDDYLTNKYGILYDWNRNYVKQKRE